MQSPRSCCVGGKRARELNGFDRLHVITVTVNVELGVRIRV